MIDFNDKSYSPLATFSDGEKCIVCGKDAWIIDGDGVEGPDGLQKFWQFCTGHVTPVTTRPLPEGISIIGGRNWKRDRR